MCQTTVDRLDFYFSRETKFGKFSPLNIISDRTWEALTKSENKTPYIQVSNKGQRYFSEKYISPRRKYKKISFLFESTSQKKPNKIFSLNLVFDHFNTPCVLLPKIKNSFS